MMRPRATPQSAFIQRLFTGIAPRYDWFNRLASCGMDRRWRTVAVKQGEIRSGHDVLDVCTGTGDLALLCAEELAGRGRIVGLDMNPGMLLRAQDKQARRGAQIGWVQGDAQRIPFATGTFDRVVIGFSTRNLPDLTTGLREMVRVLRPDGRLVILETGRPSNPILWFGYLVFLFTIARLIGWCLTGRLWPFTYLAQSVRRFVTPQQFVERLRTCQTRARYVPLSWGCASLYVATKTP